MVTGWGRPTDAGLFTRQLFTASQLEAGRDASDPAGAWRTAAAVGKRGQQELIDHLKARRMGMGGMGNEYVGRNDPAHLLSNAVNTIPAVVGGRQLSAVDRLAHHNPLGRIEMGLPSTSTVTQTTNALGSRRTWVFWERTISVN